MRLDNIWHRLKSHVCNHKMRTVVGLVFMTAELFFFLGTGCLLEKETHLLSGEGSWRLKLGEDNPAIYQEFVPSYRILDSVSFCMYMPDIAEAGDYGGTVTLSITDYGGRRLFEKTMQYQDVEDGSFTDVDVGLELSDKEKYYMVITCASQGDYPSISVCSKAYRLPESRGLVYGETLDGQHLVSRYVYADVLTISRVLMAVFLSIIAAAGIIFGITDNACMRRGIAIIIWTAAPFMLGWRLEMLNHNASLYLPFAMWWNIGIIYMLEVIVLLATYSLRFSAAVTNIAVTLLYSANYFMVMYRGTALRMNDFTAIGTAVKVVDGYDLTPNSRLAFVWGLLIIFVIYVMQTNINRDEPRRISFKFVISYICTAMLAVLMLLYGANRLLYSDFLAEAGFEGLIGFDGTDVDGFAYELMYYYDGYLAATCIEIQNSRIVKPEGYSEEAVEELLSEFAVYENVDREELPHVIMIMNESFSDLHVIGDVRLNQEPLGFFNSLRDNTVRGWVNASTFGGGTANSEFEVLTGCSMAFLPVNYYPYQQAINSLLPSMVSHMKDNGYTTISMHPESADNWNRKNIYKYYGFDTMLWKDDFEGCEIIHSGVSDAETYRRVIELYEAREDDEKLFVFDLTMQNHGGYTEDESPYEVTALNVEEEQIDQFLSLTKISDGAFEELVHYFEKQDEKVIICMFGDHQPWVFELAANAEVTKGQSSSDKIMNKYKTPFVIWANYDIDEQDGLDISMNYLGGLLMRTAHIPMSPYFRYLERKRAEHPVISSNGYVDAMGEYSAWGSNAKEFPEYRILQYNYLFDSEMVEWGY